MPNFVRSSLVVKNISRKDIRVFGKGTVRIGATVDVFDIVDSLEENVVIDSLRTGGDLNTEIYIKGTLQLISCRLNSSHGIGATSDDLLEADSVAEQLEALDIGDAGTAQFELTEGTNRVVRENATGTGLELVDEDFTSEAITLLNHLNPRASYIPERTADPTRGVYNPITNTFVFASFNNGAANSRWLISQDDGLSWEAFTEEGSGTVSKIAYGAGLFVAVRSTATYPNALISTSADGYMWTFRDGGDQGLNSIVYGNNQFVAVGNSSTILTSPDGINWTRRTSPLASHTFQDVIYGGGIYVIASNTITANSILTSPDGITWTARTTPITQAWNAVVYNNGLFIAAKSAAESPIILSYDGISWAQGNPPVYTARNWEGVAYGAGVFVAVSSALARGMRSVDGLSWQHFSTPVITTNIVYGGGQFVATGSSTAMTSPDGITWTSRTLTSHNSLAVTYGNSLYVSVASGSTGAIRTSPNGITWTSRNAPSSSSWTSVAYGNGVFVAVSSSSTTTTIYSADGTTWSSTTLPGSAVQCDRVIFANGHFTAVSTGATYKVYTSTNGITWVLASTSTATLTSSSGLAYGNGLYVIASNNIYTGLTTSAWTLRLHAPMVDLNDVIYANGMFVAVGTGNNNDDVAAYRSFDGINWQGAVTSAYTSIVRLCGLGNKIVAMGRSVSSTGPSFGMSTVDGYNWTPIKSTALNNLSSVVYADGYFVAFGKEAIYRNYLYKFNDIADATSFSAAHLRTLSSNTSLAAFDNLAFGNNRYLATSSRANNQSLFALTGEDVNTMYPVASPYTHLATTVAWDKTRFLNNRFYSTANPSVTQTAIVNPPLISTSDGYAWTDHALPVKALVQPLVDHAFGNGVYVMVGGAGSILISYDGQTWLTTRPSNRWDTPQTVYSIINAVAFGAGLFVAVGMSGYITTSSDGITWTTRVSVSATTPDLYSVVYKDSLFVAVGSATSGNRIVTSADGITWSGQSDIALGNSTIVQTHKPTSVTYAKNIFFAPGNNTASINYTYSSQISWSTSSSGNAWYNIAYGNGIFVGVGATGTGNRVGTSTNGIDWTVRSSAADNSWSGVTYGNGLFVAVALGYTGNLVMTSPDGITWTSRTSAAENLSWASIAYGNGIFVAVAASATTNSAMTSSDGITWTSRTTPIGDWRSIVYANEQFVAVGATGIRVMTSPDGINWTSRTSPSSSWRSIAYGNGLYVATGDTAGSHIMISEDAISWTEITNVSFPAAITDLSVAYGNGIFIGVAYEASSVYYISSYDGVNWAVDNVGANWRAIAAGTTTYLAADLGGSNQSGLILSSDGASWSRVNPYFTGFPSGIAYGSSLYVSVCLQNVTASEIKTSADGLIWNTVYAPENNNWTSVAYGNSTFVGVARDGTNRVMTSSDGASWTARSAAAALDWNSVAYGNGLFVAVASSGSGDRVMTSTDGITWTSRSSAADNDWKCVTYGNGLFVAVASSGSGDRVMTSTDGTTWTSRSSAENNTWESVAYGNSLYVAVSSDGTNRVMTSPDGITWTARSIIAGQYKAVTYGNSMFVAVGVDIACTSTNGTTWIEQQPFLFDWNSIVYGNGYFVAVQNTSGGLSMRSTNGAEWIVSPNPAVTAYTDVVFYDDHYVAISSGSDYRFLIQEDGYWTAQEVAPAKRVVYENNTLVSFNSDTSVIHTSTNGGTTWQSVSGGQTGIYDMAYINGQYRASTFPSTTVGQSISSSATLSSWSSETVMSQSYYSDIAYSESLDRFVAISDNGIAVADSTNFWKYIDLGSATRNFVLYANSLYVSVGSVIERSIDGYIWEDCSAPNYTYNCVAYGNGIFIAHSSASKKFVSSSDGITWSEVSGIPSNITQYSFNDVVFGGGLFTFVGDSFIIAQTSDGVTWTRYKGYDQYISLTDCIQYKDRLIATNNLATVAGSPGKIFTYDGYHWLSSETDSTVDSIATDGYKIVGFGSYSANFGNNYNYSEDGMNWITWGNGTASSGQGFHLATDGYLYIKMTADPHIWITPTYATYGVSNNGYEYSYFFSNLPYKASYLALKYLNGRFVCVATDLISYSEDGYSWTSSTPSGAWTSVTYGDGLYVAVGSNDKIAYSTDCFTWTISSTGLSNYNWVDVAYGNGVFVAVYASNYYTAYSYNGADWYPSSARILLSTTIQRMLWTGQAFIVYANSSGNTNTILISVNGIDWKTALYPIYSPQMWVASATKVVGVDWANSLSANIDIFSE